MSKVIQHIEESIEHWKRMKAWAETQKPLDYPESYDMEEYINEDWTGRCCPLCQNYKYCKGCPLFLHQGEPCDVVNKSVWGSVVKCKTWSKWIKSAVVMIATLEEVLRIEKEKQPA